MSIPDTLACGVLRTLVKTGLISGEQANDLQRQAQRRGSSTVQLAVETLELDWRSVARNVADSYNTPALDIAAFDTATLRGLPEGAADRIKSAGAWPLTVRHGQLWLGMADPGDLLLLQQAGQISGLDVNPVTLPADALLRLTGVTLTPAGEASQTAQSDTAVSTTGSDVERSTSERFLRKYVQQAIERGADTLHIEPHENQYRIRMKPEQRFETLATVPAAVGQMLTAHLAGSSQIELELSSQHVVSFHVSGLDTAAGQRIVLRRLVTMPQEPTLSALGMTEADSDRLMEAIRSSSDAPLVLVTSASPAMRLAGLHAIVHALNQPEEHVLVLTPSALAGLNGCTQVCLADEAVDTFNVTLLRVLQHDPTRLLITNPVQSGDSMPLQPACQWAASGNGQLLLGLPGQHPWLSKSPLPGIHLHLNANGRQHHWQRMTVEGSR